MPELPEVETIARRLRDGGVEPSIIGRPIAAVRVPSTRIVVGTTRPRFEAALVGRRIEGVRRRAKYLLVDLDDGAVLALHLRMTGDLHVVGLHEAEGAATRLVVELGAAARKKPEVKLVFVDNRHLGEAWLAARGAEIDVELGPEPLDPGFDKAALKAALAGRRTPIKAALLDQRVVAGIGNIYADEALFEARIPPATKVDALDDKAIGRLARAIPKVLQRSVDEMAGQIAWRYANRSAASPFAVYGREGEPCRRCGAPIESFRLAGRTTCWCPACQHG